jgi:regulatory protein
MAVAFKRTNRIYDEKSLYDYAVGALGRRMRTVAEIKRLMRTRVSRQENGQELIETVVTRLKDQKYLNDTNYATAYSGFRKDNEKFGRMRVVQDLKAKGVHGDVIEKAVGATYEGVNEEKLARDYLARKRLKKPTNEKETARVFRSMIRAGFGSRIIFKILKQWEVQDETLMALEQETFDRGDTNPEDES